MKVSLLPPGDGELPVQVEAVKAVLLYQPGGRLGKGLAVLRVGGRKGKVPGIIPSPHRKKSAKAGMLLLQGPKTGKVGKVQAGVFQHRPPRLVHPGKGVVDVGEVLGRQVPNGF